jgi:protein-disulfide isomerase
VLQQLAPDYIFTGKAKLVYNNFAVIGQESQWAAAAAECAGDQNKFWAYAVYLFDHQGAENGGAFSQENLKQFAVQLKLDTSTFNTCFDGGKYTALVQQQLQEGQSRGVRATPTFFINGQMYEGVLPYNQLVSLIQTASPR